LTTCFKLDFILAVLISGCGGGGGGSSADSGGGQTTTPDLGTLNSVSDRVQYQLKNAAMTGNKPLKLWESAEGGRTTSFD
jgi:hypothetical protein